MKFKKLRFVLVFAAAVTLLAATNGYKLFQQGLAKERAEADLRGAIQIYEQVVSESAADRKLAAQALFRIGECLRALGDAEARPVFERIVGDYADQTEISADAQARLNALRPVNKSMTARQIWARPLLNNTVSADGRYVTFTDWTKGGDLAVRDLARGITRLLTDRDKVSASYADHAVISPDGRSVAYLWVEIDEKQTFEFQVRVVPMDGETSPRIIYRNPNGKYVAVQSWSPDDQSLLIVRGLADDTWQMAMVSIDDGSVRQLKSFQWDGVRGQVSPDGRYIAYDAPAQNSPNRDIFVLAVDGSQETAVVRHPANDHRAIWSPDGSRLLFASDRTATPSLWSIPVNEGKPAGRAVLVRTDVAEIFPLGMTRSGTLYYKIPGRARRNVYRVGLREDGKASGPAEVVAARYENTNWGADISPDGESLAFYSLRPQQTLVIRNLESGQERVFPIEMGTIIGGYFQGPEWFADGRSVLIRVRQNERKGPVSYRFDVTTGKSQELDRLGDGHLYRMSRDGASAFYRSRGVKRLVRFDFDEGRETILISAPQRAGITDLALSPDGKQLAYNLQQDLLEKGTRLMVMSSVEGKARDVFRDIGWGLGGGQRFNALAWTSDQRHLLFVRTEEAGSPSDCMFTNSETCEQSIWRVPIDGGQAERIGVSMRLQIQSLRADPDGQSIYFSAVGADDQIWALENFLPELSAKK